MTHCQIPPLIHQLPTFPTGPNKLPMCIHSTSVLDKQVRSPNPATGQHWWSVTAHKLRRVAAHLFRVTGVTDVLRTRLGGLGVAADGTATAHSSPSETTHSPTRYNLRSVLPSGETLHVEGMVAENGQHRLILETRREGGRERGRVRKEKCYINTPFSVAMQLNLPGSCHPPVCNWSCHRPLL